MKNTHISDSVNRFTQRFIGTEYLCPECKKGTDYLAAEYGICADCLQDLRYKGKA